MATEAAATKSKRGSKLRAVIVKGLTTERFQSNEEIALLSHVGKGTVSSYMTLIERAGAVAREPGRLRDLARYKLKSKRWQSGQALDELCERVGGFEREKQRDAAQARRERGKMPLLDYRPEPRPATPPPPPPPQADPSD